ncbi:MAG: hypothetical protein ACN6OP_22930 [Pseudomonadales bacterium]
MTNNIYPFRVRSVQTAQWFNNWYATMKDTLTKKHGSWVSDGRSQYKVFSWNTVDVEITSADKATVFFYAYNTTGLGGHFLKLVLEQKAKGLAAVDDFQDVLAHQRVRVALASLERLEERERIARRIMRVEQIHENLFGAKPKNGARDLMKEIVR